MRALRAVSICQGYNRDDARYGTEGSLSRITHLCERAAKVNSRQRSYLKRDSLLCEEKRGLILNSVGWSDSAHDGINAIQGQSTEYDEHNCREHNNRNFVAPLFLLKGFCVLVFILPPFFSTSSATARTNDILLSRTTPCKSSFNV